MQIKIQEIKENFIDSYYNRGIGYFNTKKVLNYSIERDSDHYVNIISEVQGSSEIYSQDIDIKRLKNGSLDINSNCSCPVGFNCKHVVAVCLTYRTDAQTNAIAKLQGIETKSTVNLSQIDSWLKKLQADNEQTKELDIVTQNMKNGEYFFTYRLFDSSSPYTDEIEFYKSKILKNGSISQGSRIHSHNLSNYANEKLKNDLDTSLINSVISLHNKYRYNSGGNILIGITAYKLVKELLETGRFYLDKHKKPIEFIEGIFTPNYEFKLYKGKYQLKSNIDATNHRLIDTTPSLIVDKVANTMQEIDINVKVYRHLLNAPAIDKKDIAKVYTSIGKALVNVELKAPSAIKTKKIKSKPISQLHLKYTKDENDKKFTSFSVDFNYEDYTVKYYPQNKIKSLYNDETKVEIQRDLKYEEGVKKELEDFGFKVDNIANNLFVTLVENDKQAQLKVWKEFMTSHLDVLKSQGWIVDIDEEFSMRFEPSTEVVVENENENNWFSLSFNLEFNGVSQPIAPLVSEIINEFNDLENLPEFMHLEVAQNHFVEVQSSQIKPIIQTIIELFDKKDKDESLKISAYDAHMLAFMDDDVIWRGSREILELSKKLKDFKGIKKSPPPKCLNATLRDYQQDGLNWLNFLYEFKFGGILADDMGLGKTIQTLAHISRLKEDNKLTGKVLIIMPTSLIANWKNEAKRFTPNLKVLSLHGQDRADRFEMIDDYDVLLSTYPLIVRDEEKFKKYKFMYIILDEAQKIKNHKTKMAITLKKMKSQYRLALSGTPIENHLGELWSIFSFLMPGFLDTMSFFKKYYQTPIEKEHNFQRQNILNRRIKPFMIRRTKEIVAQELPSKSEIIKYTQFDNKQSKLYESIRVTMEEKVRDAVSAKGIGSSHITILDALLKLRQVCCDPSLLKLQEAQKVKESAKLELFTDLIDELLREGRKILVFSQFTSMLAILEDVIKRRNISYAKLTGSTRKREEVIEKFTSGEADIFLISLKAGGVGLNLTQADTVIHYDPWWNPAVENQATDRAHRIGQTKAVFVYKLIVENTIEQKILEMQERKKKLQDGIYDDKQQQDDIKFSGVELLELLK
ncbi:MAG: DEAD/DEAH box helicase [Sulfurimonas sp.]